SPQSVLVTDLFAFSIASCLYRGTRADIIWTIPHIRNNALEVGSHFVVRNQEKRFPCKQFTFAHQQKRFPREHFAFARQEKRFPREHFAFPRQQKRFPRCRSTQPPQPGGARSRKFSLYAAAGNSFHRSAITPRRFNAGMVPPASPSQLVPSSGA